MSTNAILLGNSSGSAGGFQKDLLFSFNTTQSSTHSLTYTYDLMNKYHIMLFEFTGSLYGEYPVSLRLQSNQGTASIFSQMSSDVTFNNISQIFIIRDKNSKNAFAASDTSTGFFISFTTNSTLSWYNVRDTTKISGTLKIYGIKF